MEEFRTEMQRWAPMTCWFNATMLRRSLISACLVSFASLYLLSCVATRSQRSPGNLLGSRRSCDVKLEDVSRFSRSQDKEDECLVQNFFENICGGTYVELGALDGVKYSNSHLFHYGLDWRGVLIEPNPKNFRALRHNRPEDDTFNYAVCASSSKVRFVGDRKRGATSGVLEFMDPSFVKEWHPNIDIAKLPTIDCKSLSDILDESLLVPGQAIDFLSLDVEGAELEVLKTLNFTKHIFGVIFYENGGKDLEIKKLLDEHGYEFRFQALRSNFHTNRRWDDIYHLL